MCYGYLNVFFGIENVFVFLVNWILFLLFSFIDCEYSRDGYFFSFISDCYYFIGDYINVMWMEEFFIRFFWDIVVWKY